MMPLKKPRLLNLAAGVSLLLAIATAVLWVRSYRISDQLGWTGHTWTVAIMSSDGSVGLYADLLNATGVAAGRPLGFTQYHLHQTLGLTNPHIPGVTPQGRAGFVISRGQTKGQGFGCWWCQRGRSCCYWL